jgi:protein-disulfide isomerase
MYKKEEIPVIEPKDIIVGNADAAVTVVEFIDYESERCAQVHDIVKKIMVKFNDKVNFNFRHFP